MTSSILVGISAAASFLLAQWGLSAALSLWWGAWMPHAAMVGAVGGMAWLAHSADSRGMAEDVRRALSDAGLSDKEAAYYLGISKGQLSDQLSGSQMLSLWRLASLPDTFQIAFATRRIQRYGTHLVIERGLLADLIGRVDRLTRKGDTSDAA